MKTRLRQNKLALLFLLVALGITTYAFSASEQSLLLGVAPGPQPTASQIVLPESHTAVELSQQQLTAPSAQFAVSQNVIAGGGGTSTGGGLRLEGTVGQPAMGNTSSNGQFSETGGFWPGQSEVSPTATPTRHRAQPQHRLHADSNTNTTDPHADAECCSVQCFQLQHQRRLHHRLHYR